MARLTTHPAINRLAGLLLVLSTTLMLAGCKADKPSSTEGTMPSSQQVFELIDKLVAATKPIDVEAIKPLVHQPEALSDRSVLKELFEFTRWVEEQSMDELRAEATVAPMEQAMAARRIKELLEGTDVPAKQCLVLTMRGAEVVVTWDGTRLALLAVDEELLSQGNLIWR